MASWQATAAPAPARVPVRRRPRPRTAELERARPAAKRRAQSKGGVAGGIVWIAVAGVLLAGIVALNVAVLRLNVQLDRMNNQSDQLRADNAALGAKISAASSSPRILTLAHARGFVPANPTTIGYIDLTPRRPR